MDRTKSFLTTPVAILIGCSLIAVSVLISGGVIKVNPKVAGTPTTASPAPAAQQPAPQNKSEADIIKGLKSLATKLNLDANKFNTCLDSGSKASLVKADADYGATVDVGGTPATFINGRFISGAAPFSAFKIVIDEELSGSAATDVTRKTVNVGNLPVLGNQDAKVTIVEFSDYQCPFCGKYFQDAEAQIKKEYVDTGKAKFYYRDFPLIQLHPGAQKAAEAARCAGDQGKYWEFHDLVFQNQSNIF